MEIFNKGRVLAIDDNANMLETYQDAFEDNGYVVFLAANGEEAKEKVRETLPEVVITDLRMPRADGLEVLKYVKTHYPNTPVIVVSGKGEMQDSIQALRYGAWDYFPKPIQRLEKLYRSMDNAIEHKRILEENQEYQKNLEEKVNKRTHELQKSYDQMERIMQGTIDSLAKAVEMTDAYTAKHQKNVTRLACKVGSRLGLTQEQLNGLRYAATIHDIGKISVPGAILYKPTELDGMEFGLIKRHACAGYNILKDVKFPWPVAEIVHQHHERIDGSGYPRGLKGEQILLEARILEVVDVFDAIESHRPYRPARGPEEAKKEIRKNKGILYDENVVNTFLEMNEE